MVAPMVSPLGAMKIAQQHAIVIECGAMDKATAIKALGCRTATAAAKAIGVSHQAFFQAPDPLPPRIADRVLATIARRELPAERLRELGVDVRSRAAEEQAEASHG